MAVRNVGQYEDEGGWGFDRKSDFLTTSHVIRLFGAGTQVFSLFTINQQSDDDSDNNALNRLQNQNLELYMLLEHLICFMLDMFHS